MYESLLTYNNCDKVWAFEVKEKISFKLWIDTMRLRT
jgi:hypothetical protein